MASTRSTSKAGTATTEPTTTNRLAAEFLGTFVLVLGGCGSAVLAAVFLNDDDLQLGIGFLGVALAFGLTVTTMAYAVGHVSGGHFNPAVTLGLAASRRFAWRDCGGYIVTQVVAAIVAAAVLYVIASGVDGFSASETGFATNGYGDRSPGGYSLLACLVAEVVMTAVFLFVILGVTDTRAPKGFAPLAIGLSLTLIHLVIIPVTNTSVNPARSIGPALFAGGDAIAQLWLFILAPIAGALIAGFSYAVLLGQGPSAPLEEATAG
ncbi:MAG TPA: aquaporin Z [Nocardioides sp.]|jgi:aquaporin Z|nr:aquaporin Z [Nocardioides sp.]